jgi:hypothetical protein
VELFRAQGFPATRRVWALGDTVAIPVGPEESHGGVVAYRFVAWLAPRGAEGWDFVHPLFAHERRLPFDTLERACEAALRLLPLHDPHDTCPACGGPRRVAFGERPPPALSRWYLSTSCASCGARAECDGDGDLPDDLRAMEEARNGRWAVVVTREPTTRGWQDLRSALGLELSALVELRRRLPGVVFEGTFAQAYRIRELYREGGATVEITETASGMDHG